MKDLEDLRASFRKAAHYTNGMPVYPEGELNQEMWDRHLKIEREFASRYAAVERDGAIAKFIMTATLVSIGVFMWWLICT